jgi:hypothetical protein
VRPSSSSTPTPGCRPARCPACGARSASAASSAATSRCASAKASATDRLFAGSYAAQERLFGVFYGDSAIFARTSAFASVGGFPDEPIFEDLGLVRRLRRAGRLVTISPAVTTSSRRYRARPVRAILRWASLLPLYGVGVPPRRLASLYPPVRARRTPRP